MTFHSQLHFMTKMTPQHLVETGLLPRGECGPDSVRLKTAPGGAGWGGQSFWYVGECGLNNGPIHWAPYSWATGEAHEGFHVDVIFNWASPGNTSGKEPTCEWRRHKRWGFDSWVGKIAWRRAWPPTPAFWPGESPGQRSLAGRVHRTTKSGTELKRLSTQHNKAHILIPRTCEYVALRNRRDSAGVIKLRLMRWAEHPELARWSLIIHKRS